MTRRVSLVLTLLLVYCAFVSSQNLQLHFDPRHTFHGDYFPRNYLTATFEMFKPDKWGSTFMFVDVDFSQERGNIGLAYTEIARDQKIGKSPVMAHVEFNGGIRKFETAGFSIPNAYMVGPSYATRFGKLNFSTYLVYKYNSFEKASHDMQWTGIWNVNLCNDKLTMSGFLDIWTENKHTEKAGFKSGKRVILLTEPQFWYNVTSNLSFGSEVEISNNFFGGINRPYINPTLAGKWNF